MRVIGRELSGWVGRGCDMIWAVLVSLIGVLGFDCAIFGVWRGCCCGLLYSGRRLGCTI